MTHGMRGTALHMVWKNMLTRVRNPHSEKFPSYGGRGITVCERWLRFENFMEDMGASFSPELQLERIDNDGNYEPNNCCWTTRKEQGRNKRNNVFITYKGITRTLPEWADTMGIYREVLRQRIDRYGWSVDRALTTPVRRLRARKLR